MALKLTVKDGEPFTIGEATIWVNRRGKTKSSVVIEAPKEVPIRRAGVTGIKPVTAQPEEAAQLEATDSLSMTPLSQEAA